MFLLRMSKDSARIIIIGSSPRGQDGDTYGQNITGLRLRRRDMLMACKGDESKRGPVLQYMAVRVTDNCAGFFYRYSSVYINK